MDLIQSTLVHKILPPRIQAQGKAPALIMLHGRGADENDLFGLSEFLDERLFIISVRAPFDFGYTGGFTWYEIYEVGKPDIKMYNESYSKLIQFLEDCIKGYPIDPGKIFLFGFSMGSMMSYATVLTHPEMIKGVIANSGLLPENTVTNPRWDKLKGKPFFVSHGIYDSLIPISFAKRSKELLTNAGANLTYREYEVDHQIDEACLHDISHWLESNL